MTIQVGGTTVVSTDRSITLGTATPGSPATGMIRYNSSLAEFQIYNGTAWVAMITTGSSTNVAYSVGVNDYSGLSGMLGDNTIINRSSPVAIAGGFTDWTQLSCGTAHMVALRQGIAWAWGIQSFSTVGGLVGDNTSIPKSSPVSVVGDFTDWAQIAAGNTHTSALRANGTIWSWGSNNYGQLGINDALNRSSPVSLLGGVSSWRNVSAGYRHSAAIKTDGTAWTWGRNGYGSLGDNTTVDKSSPVSVVGSISDWISVSCGQNFSAGIRANGTAWTWGDNRDGELGINNNIPRSSPVSVLGSFSDWTSLSAHGTFTVGLRTNGTIWTWGLNYSGQLGDGTYQTKSSPVSVLGGFTDWVFIPNPSSGLASHVVAIRANGTLWAWGRNHFGQLGVNHTNNRSSPVSVLGGFSDWITTSTGQISSNMLRTGFTAGGGGGGGGGGGTGL